MRIGLDFDGVISDCGRLKSEGAKLLYGIEIPPERFKREFVVGEILTSDEYTRLQNYIYDDREIGLKIMLPVDGAIEYIGKLRKEGHELLVVSSRGVGKKLDAVREWMELKGLYLNIVGVGGGSKADACRGLDVYIDDDLDKLEPLVDVVPNRYLFSWGYNEHIEVPEGVAKRVSSWKDFYEEVERLKS